MANTRGAHGDFCVTLFSISVATGLVTNFAALLPQGVTYALYALSLVCGYGGLFLYLTSRRPGSVVRVWLLLVIFMALVGAVQSDLWRNGFDVGIFLAQDCRYVMYLAIGFVFADRPYLLRYHRIVVRVGYVGLALGAIALLTFPFGAAASSTGERIGIWSFPYYVWWISGGVYAYLYPYARICGRNKIVGYGALLVYSVLGLLFLKRSALINAALIILLSEYVRSRLSVPDPKRPRYSLSGLTHVLALTILWSLTAVIALQIPVVKNVLELVFARFDVIDAYGGYDRGLEWDAYLKQASLFDILAGQGMGHYVDLSFGTIYYEVELTANALHVGLGNLVYKGGVLYLVFVMWILSVAVISWNSTRRLSPYLAVCLVTTTCFLVSLTYEGSWTYSILEFGYAAPIAYLIQNRKYPPDEDLFSGPAGLRQAQHGAL